MCGRWLWRGGDSCAVAASTSGPATELDLQMMQRALELAEAAAAMGEVPVGAVVYELATGKIIAEAHNRREVDRDPSAHAELLAIREAARVVGGWRLTSYGLAVTLEPCAMCSGLIVNARVGRLVFGATDPKAGFCGSLGNITNDPRLNHRVLAVGGVLAEESGVLLKAFFKARRGGGRGLGTKST